MRSKIFRRGLFERMWERMGEAVARHAKRGRQILIAGLAKRSKAIDFYALAFHLEGVLVQPGSCYLEVPPEIEREVYKWEEYARGIEGEAEGGEWTRFVQGALYLAKFGESPYDPISPVDIWLQQRERADEVMGYLLADARAGFRISNYPLSLQRAHEFARLSGFDMEVLRDLVMDSLSERYREERFDQFAFAVGRRRSR